MTKLYATCCYDGMPDYRDDAIRRAAKKVAPTAEKAGSGYFLPTGTRDVGFILDEEDREVFATAVEVIDGVTVEFNLYNDGEEDGPEDDSEPE